MGIVVTSFCKRDWMVLSEDMKSRSRKGDPGGGGFDVLRNWVESVTQQMPLKVERGIPRGRGRRLWRQGRDGEEPGGGSF